MILIGRGRSVVIPVVGAVSVVFFGMCGAYTVWRLLRPLPARVVNRQGIMDDASLLGI